MKRLRSMLQKKEGTTLVETMVCLLLISIMLAEAASALMCSIPAFLSGAEDAICTVYTGYRNDGIENNYPKCEWVCENL